MDIAHPVHRGLRGLVNRMQGYDFRLDPHAVHHGVPSPAATVIISFDEPLDVGWQDDPTSRVQRWLLASGMHTRPAIIHTHGTQHGIQLDLTPAGCRALLGLPIGPIARGLADHTDVPLGIPEHLHARLADAPWPTRFGLLEDHLLRLATRDRTRVPDDLAQAWRVLATTRGRVGVADLARGIGWSRRHLVNRFTAEFGLPPRDLGRLHRFGAAQRYARQGVPWAEVAARAGYADQAHLSREFREFAGQTPTAWRAEAFPIVQDAEDPAAQR
ncbi:helix-turn-helix domain-containing protein [Granulicoccus sp. GXG6511]|uniref:helix-turn-helix domain-containing protein n=1 Tax=Granulicoccus sp. GXG6511 TaxID=3381351 RepID=UPI003D7DB4C9